MNNKYIFIYKFSKFANFIQQAIAYNFIILQIININLI